jgi:hypothetical protein
MSIEGPIMHHDWMFVKAVECTCFGGMPARLDFLGLRNRAFLFHMSMHPKQVCSRANVSYTTVLEALA